MNNQPSPDTVAGEPPIYAEMIADLLIAMFGSTGLRLSVLDRDGMPVGRMGNKKELCDYVMNCPDTQELCTLCTQRGLEVVRRTGEPYTYRCHMGLVSTIIPVRAQETAVAFLVFSGYHMEPEQMEGLPMPVAGADRTRQFMAPTANPEHSPYFSRERVEEITRLLSVFASFLVDVSGRTRMLLDVQNQGLELLAQANIREQQEKKATLNRMRDLTDRIRDEFLFDAMDHIAMTALQEGAPQSARLIGELAQHTRKGRQPGAWVTLGEELDNLHSYLHLLQSMYEDRIAFRLDQDRCGDRETELIQIPFATMIEFLLHGPLGNVERDGVLEVRLVRSGGTLEVTVADNCGGYSPAALRRLNNLQFTDSDTEGRVLTRMVSELKESYGPQFRWKFLCDPGTKLELTLYLPIREAGAE